MPFTLAHPAAVLWLARGPLSLLALVSGAVAPDLPYYLRTTPLPVTAESWYEPYVNATASHTLGAVVPVALPLAVAVYLCGRLLLPPLHWVAGIEAQAAPTRTIAQGAWVIVSLVIGVLTHLGWDWVTELGGPASRLLQHGSTILGLVLLGVFVLRRRPVVRDDASVRCRFVVTVAICTLVALAGALGASWSWLDSTAGLSTGEVVEGVIADAVEGAGIGFAAAAVALALLWWVSGAGRRPALPS